MQSPVTTRISRLLARVAAALAVATAVATAEPAPDTAGPHWAFRPIHRPAAPDLPGIAHPVDRFLLARLTSGGLEPAPEAGRRVLLRRAALLLTGLPPRPEEVEAFVGDATPDAWPRAVERLLASPHYGERWARWWLDLARYADTNGQDENKVMANAWRYRDWVVRQFNADTPLDRFLTEQLAGDLLPADGVSEAERLERLTATGFLVLGPKRLAEQDKPKLVMDLVDEQIDTVGRAFLGLTVSCARCHDHKTDPIPTRDYYALAGVFRSTRTLANLDFVSKSHERDVTPAAVRAAHDAHRAETGRLRADLAGTRSDADADLLRAWRGAFPASLRAALGTPPAAGGGPDTPDPALAERLRGFLGATNTPADAVAVLRDLAGSSPGSAPWQAFLDAELHRNALRLTGGVAGAAFRATGSNHLARAHAPDLEPAQLTAEAWVRADDFPRDGDTRRWLVAKNDNEWAGGHYALLLDRDRPGACLNIGGGRTNVFLAWADTARLEAGRWHHLALTYDGRDLALHVDGRQAARLEVGRPRVPGSGAVVLGMRPDGHVHFRGALDTVRIHRRALDAAAIEALAGGGSVPDPVGVVAEWTFDDLDDALRAAAVRADLHARVFGPGGPAALPADPLPLYPPGIRQRLTGLEATLAALEAAAPPPLRETPAVEDDRPVDLPVHRRGSHLSLEAEPVPRGFLRRVGAPDPGPLPAGRSGRLELARWLTSPAQPLTARVLVNRIWQAHFGNGLVRTPDNFGRTGERPTHPELLDWLAAELRDSGWSLKHMHRLILTSAAWRRSAAGTTPGASDTDPENRLLARFPRQRLEAEMVRDAMLAVSGRLDPAMGGSLTGWKNNEYVPRDEVSDRSTRRSVYLPVVRDRVHDALAAFDFANPAVGTARRTPTVVAQQALFLLNSPLARESARALAGLLLDRPGPDAARVAHAWQLLYGRPPSGPETARALAFLGRPGAPDRPTAWAEWCQVLMASNEFLHIE